tara:strand:+ start:88243 stop:88929 length:687 start_codon:yes stop_codon:yes gene_type:complete
LFLISSNKLIHADLTECSISESNLNQQQLSIISDTTLDHYNQRAAAFWEGTRTHDVRQNIDALLKHISAAPPFTILDFGCGPGRDLKAFSDLGHQVIGIDGAQEFAKMAREYTGCEVWQQDFLQLDLPAEYFDGVFANASLFHVPAQELPRVLKQLYATLKPSGVLFSSNPRGANQEGWSAGRYGSYHELENWRTFLTDAGFSEIDHYYRPAGLPREQQAWLASIWRK